MKIIISGSLNVTNQMKMLAKAGSFTMVCIKTGIPALLWEARNFTDSMFESEQYKWLKDHPLPKMSFLLYTTR